MPTIDKVKNTKHGQYIIELAPGSSLHKEITAPMVGAGGGLDMEDANLAIGFAYLTKPFVMIPDAHKHPFDQFLMFFGAPPNDFTEFDAEIELTLDGKVNKITYPSYVFIPKGLMHCPLVVKRVGKPIIFADSRLSKEASIRAVVKK